MSDELVTPDPWRRLCQLTPARIALGRAGDAQPTAAHLAFQLAHAQARDAVHLAFDAERLAGDLIAAGFATLTIHSAAPDRATYLRRPDLGRRLDEQSRDLLAAQPVPVPPPDLAFVVADGLSALAVQRHAVPLLTLVAASLQPRGWCLAPVVLAHQARVALGDEVGAALGATLVAVLIGERPGLSAADSLGVYLTYWPQPGRTDAERNCISNIRPEGLGYEAARDTLVYLASEARRLFLTGVALKDERGTPELPTPPDVA